jgi:hypothetical protein
MVTVDDGLAPPLPVREHDITTSVVPESSAVVAATSIEGTTDTSSSQYMDFPGIWIIDLDATKLSSNDREILEAVTERMFADPSILDSITSDPPAPRQDESTGCLVPSAAPEVVEGVLRESAAGTESAVIDPLPTSVRENTDAPLLQPAEAAMTAPTPSVVSAVEGVVGGVGPSSPQPVAATAEEVLVPSQPIVSPQERDAPRARQGLPPPKSATPLRARQESPPQRSRRPRGTRA